MSALPKPLVLCADDYAQHAGVTQAVLALADAGRLTATSAMVLSPRWPADAAPLRERRGRIDVGLHLDFTSDFAIATGHGHCDGWQSSSKHQSNKSLTHGVSPCSTFR